MAEAAVRPTPELDDTIERLPTSFDLCYTWNYETLRQELRNLYEKAKRDQWNAPDQLPWSTSVDPEAEIVPDFQIPVYDTHIWAKLTPAEIRKLRREALSWTLSQFMHGEQGALLATAQITTATPWIESKFYAASQVMDEPREREEFLYEGCRLMRDRLLMEDVWEVMGWPVEEVREIVLHSRQMQEFRKMLFSKIVPNVKRLGLLSPYVRERFAELGILQFENEEPSA